ncbi:riboflavin biosynthesis protein RibF (plasmid) [Paracoccus ferrooxidans]|nr:riboflavin biosynthesis protein RibF [Paracoccus ferrooxidans]
MTQIPSSHPFRPELAILRSGIATGSALRRGVVVLGNFDGFHRGHQFLIRSARRIAADGRAVGVMSVEPHPRQVFSPEAAPFRLALPEQKHRTARRIGLDYLFEPVFDRAFAGMTPCAFIDEVLCRRLGVSHVVVGADFHFGAKRAGTTRTLAQECTARGIGVTVLPLQGGFSSTAARQAILAGDMRQARRCLGRPWEGVLDAGRLAPDQIRPPAGRYLVRTHRSAQAGPVRLDADGRILSPDSLPRRIEFLDRHD